MDEMLQNVTSTSFVFSNPVVVAVVFDAFAKYENYILVPRQK